MFSTKEASAKKGRRQKNSVVLSRVTLKKVVNTMVGVFVSAELYV